MLLSEHFITHLHTNIKGTEVTKLSLTLYIITKD